VDRRPLEGTTTQYAGMGFCLQPVCDSFWWFHKRALHEALSFKAKASQHTCAEMLQKLEAVAIFGYRQPLLFDWMDDNQHEQFYFRLLGTPRGRK
jgi:hypothetical protein